MSSTAPISDFCDVPHRAEATAALLVLPALATSAFAAAAGCGEVSVASKEEAAQFRALLPDASELDPAQLRVAERLGGGTWSAVHRGELLGRAVAVKLLRAGRMLVPSSADRPLQDQALLAAGVLAREAAFLSELRHPRVVELLTVGILQGRPCLVLELAHGSLHSLLHGGLSANSVSEVPLGPAQRWSMAIHVAEGVSYLHAHQPGVVHCDLKSSNILVFHNNMSNNNNSNSNNNTNNKEGLPGIPGTQVLTAKLADFGLARRHHNNNSNKNNNNNNKKTQHNNNNNNKNNDNTNTNTNNNTNNTNNIPAAQPDALSGEAGNLCRGSGAYLAPECLADPSEIQGPTVDLWALGCVLVEVFGGAPPHTECESMEQVLAKVLGRGEVLTASADRTARIWSLPSGQCERTLTGHSAGVCTACFSPDGSKVLTASGDRTARLWSVATGECLQKLSGHSAALYTAVFSPSGRKVLTASHDKTARVFDLGGGPVRVLSGHRAHIYRAAFSSDGSQVLTASADKTARLFDTETGDCKQVFGDHDEAVYTAIFSPDGGQVLTGSADMNARLFDVLSGTLLCTFEGHILAVHTVAFSPDARHVLTAADDRCIRVFDAQNGACELTFEGHGDHVYCAVFSPDGRQVLAGAEDGTAKLFAITA
ncbi:unnamed protein product [Polarella glacialis]|uniref:Protein kinase domain-containing protein n=1 Tax=Polarella glacialis TaxID=89957 RepID=A0A813DLZ5_POLGL|nr:unnamed protein product [Polarella glacialis]